MRITPLDVRKQEFDRALRGLDPDEVHAFLATVADEYEAVLTDNKQLREKVIELDQKVAEYRNMERTLRDTLLTAERVMTDARQNARKEAENILREAEVKAREATADIQNQVDALRGQMRELRGQRDSFMARLQSLAEAQVGLTESYRKDFKDDDARVERLMRDPGHDLPRPSVDDIVEPDPKVDETPAAPDGTQVVPPVDLARHEAAKVNAPSEPAAPTPSPAPAPDPTPPTTPQAREDDTWRGYDLGVGDTPTPPPSEPVDTHLPKDPPSPTESDDATRRDDDPDLGRSIDEVTDAVDTALDDSGPVQPITGTPAAAPMEAAEAAGQTAETLATPDVPDPTGETPIEPAGEQASTESTAEGDDETQGRWSLSRFTKGLSSF